MLNKFWDLQKKWESCILYVIELNDFKIIENERNT